MTRTRPPVLALGAIVALLCVAAVAAVVTVALAVEQDPDDDRAAPAPVTAAPTSDAATPRNPDTDSGSDLLVPGSGELAAAGGSDRARASEPVGVRVPSLGISSTLEDLRTDASGRLQSPKEWQQAGWFAEGAVPGEIGPAVVAGHVDSPTGPAVFARLGELAPGDLVEVERADGEVARFRVDRAEVVAKDDFPTEAVYGPTPDPQLRLITCDGPYVRSSGGYQDNLVVFASEVRS